MPKKEPKIKREIRRVEDIIGKKFEKLTVDKLHHIDKYKIKHWDCICECGEHRIVRGADLRKTKITRCKSCAKKFSQKANGHATTRLYAIWSGIKRRCNNKNAKAFKYYGDKGVEICNQWNESYLIFEEWALNNGYKDNLTIERLNPFGNYEPKNCTWIPLKEQAYNKRDTLWIKINGEILNTKQIVEKYDVTLNQIYYRHKVGKDILSGV